MKKRLKSLKGFTLIELIIVMAILVSLLTAILQLMEPVQEAYRDSTIYEQQRTVENGIISYIAESTRYAKAISIIDEGVGIDTNNDGSADIHPNNLTAAANYFINKNNLKVADYKNIEVIVIDRSTKFQYKGKDVQGRLVRIRGLGDTSLSVPSWGATVSEADLKGSAWNTKACYMAMGPDYYGDMSFDIVLPNKWEDYLPEGAPDGTADAINQLQRGFDIEVSPKTPKKTIETKTNGSVTSMNYFVTPAFIDYQTYLPDDMVTSGSYPTAHDNSKPVAGTTGSSEELDTYIFFLRPVT